MYTYGFQFISEGTNCLLSVQNKLFQVLIPQLLPSATLAGTLATALEFGSFVDLGRFPARSFAGAFSHCSVTRLAAVFANAHDLGINNIRNIRSIPNNIKNIC